MLAQASSAPRLLQITVTVLAVITQLASAIQR
jgi:hypothetical protein